jgi:hypothetical protein
MPLDQFDRQNLGFAEVEPKLVNDQPVAALPDGRERSQALIDALASRDYSGSRRLPERPITDPYADRVAH